MNIINYKDIPNFQHNFMFRVWFPVVPLVNITSLPSTFFPVFNKSNSYFTLLCRNTVLPGFKRNYQILRLMDSQSNIPTGSTHDGEFTADFILDSENKFHTTICQWYDSVNFKGMPSYFGPNVDVYLEFLNLSNETNYVHRIIDLEPKNKPPIEGLSQDNIEGFLTCSVTFTFEDIDYNIDVKTFKTLIGAQ
jgi:hypothetical protein